MRGRARTRLLSAFLTFCMIAGVLPAGLPRANMADPEAQTQIVLDFKAEWEKPEAERRTPLQASLAIDGWQINREKTAGSLVQGSTAFDFQPYGIRARVMDATYPKHSDLAIDFSVAAEGTYALALSGGQFGEIDGATAGIYVDNTYLGEYRFVGDNLLVGETKTLGEIALTRGTHTVTLRRINGGNPSFLFPGCISFSMTKAARAEETLDFIGAYANEYLNSTSGTPLDATIATHGWAINLDQSAGSVAASQKPRYAQYGIAVQIADANYEKHADLAFDFNLDKEADYALSLVGGQYDGGATADVYLDGQKLGSYDFSGANVMTGAIAAFEKTHLSRGTHTVTLRRTSGADGGSYLFPGQIRLVEESTAFHFNVQLTDETGAAKTRFEPGDIVYAKVYLNGGTPLQFGAMQADISYDSARLALLEDETSAGARIAINKRYGADGKIIRLAYGGERLTADDAYLLATIAWRVREDAAGGTAAVHFNEAKAAEYNNSAWSPTTAAGGAVMIQSATKLSAADCSVTLGETARTEITARRGNAAVALDQAEITVVSANPAIATGEIARDGGRVYLSVTGVQLGETTAEITAVIQGEALTKTVAITVNELCYYYNYRKLWGGKVYNVGTDIRTVTSYDMTTTGSESEINKAVGIASDPWIYGGADADGAGNFFFTDNTYACQLRGESGWNAVRIQVPKDGVYEAVAACISPRRTRRIRAARCIICKRLTVMRKATSGSWMFR